MNFLFVRRRRIRKRRCRIERLKEADEGRGGEVVQPPGEFHCRGSKTRNFSVNLMARWKPLVADCQRLTYCSIKGCATRRRSIRDREVAGSNPVAPIGRKFRRILDLGACPSVSGSAAQKPPEIR
jgi:hypothetical protein